MYRINDEQIDYIAGDLQTLGIENEDLQSGLLDHICCILERDMQERDDFEQCYRQTLKQFYHKEIREIEKETNLLITFKNYYEMKRLMVLSGIFTVIAFIIGSFFKLMFWPGAGALLISAMVVFSLVFLPLLFLLKTREAGSQRDKIVLGIGGLVGILYCLSTIFLLNHWPGYRMLWFLTLGLSFFVLVPVYFFSGIRKPETRANTIVATVLLLGVLGIQFTMTSLRPSSQTLGRIYTYLQSEELLQKMRSSSNAQLTAEDRTLATGIQNTCEEIKQLILNQQLEQPNLTADFEAQKIAEKEKYVGRVFFANGRANQLFTQLQQQVASYNKDKVTADQIPVTRTILDTSFSDRDFFSSLFVLNNLTQLQIYLANTTQVVAMQ